MLRARSRQAEQTLFAILPGSVRAFCSFSSPLSPSSSVSVSLSFSLSLPPPSLSLHPLSLSRTRSFELIFFLFLSFTVCPLQIGYFACNEINTHLLRNPLILPLRFIDPYGALVLDSVDPLSLILMALYVIGEAIELKVSRWDL